jgi:hypothetical protein
VLSGLLRNQQSGKNRNHFKLLRRLKASYLEPKLEEIDFAKMTDVQRGKRGVTVTFNCTGFLLRQTVSDNTCPGRRLAIS